MNQTPKHSFEAMSLLITDNGMLDVTIVPAANQPDWLIPSNLILSVDSYDEYVDTYSWQQQEVVVFHLIPKSQTPDKLIVLEGNTESRRLALQTTGELRHIKVGISDVKDTSLPQDYEHLVADSINDVNSSVDDLDDTNDKPNNIHENSDKSSITTADKYFGEDDVNSYLFQTVEVADVVYVIADLDEIVHKLIDVDDQADPE